MAQIAQPTGRIPGDGRTRVWIDMCADVFHYGHANAIRQAKELGDVLVVGVHPDEEITQAKGAPIMGIEDRMAVVSACRWVDEITSDAPYQTSMATLDRFNVDFCVHGEDISVGADGRDSFYEVKEAGRFKLIKRTEGVSTTDMVLHMLQIADPNGPVQVVPYARNAQPFLSTRVMYEFMRNSARLPTPEDRRVYIDGAFDILHRGHVHALREARARGTYVIVGLHSDYDLFTRRGQCHPVMSLHERALLLLAMRDVDEVVMSAPVQITRDFLTSLRIDEVVHGPDTPTLLDGEPDPYKAAREMGVYTEFEAAPNVEYRWVIDRVYAERERYLAKMARKKQNIEKEAEIAAKSV